MQKELNEADKIIKFLNQFTLQNSSDQTILKKTKSHDPVLLLQTNNFEEFLMKTKEFFENKNFVIEGQQQNEKRLLEVTNSRLEANYEELLDSIKVGCC